MLNYMVKHDGTIQHYFCTKNEGLCVRTKRHSIWQNHKIIYKDCAGPFSVFCDKNGVLHAICVSSQNEIIYLVLRKNGWQSCAITHLKENMKVLFITITETSIGLNILYTAQYMSETILIHCVLGNNAMPNTLDRLTCPSFFIFKNRVYYTNPEGFLGYRDISDGRPDMFNKLVEGGTEPYLLTHEGKDMLVYKKEKDIYFQNRPIHEDSYASSPILANNGNQLLLMWKNGDFIRYISSSDNGGKWSGVMQFVNPGKESEKYYVVNSGKIFTYFGNHSSADLHIYGKNDIFEKEQPAPTASAVTAPDPNQITKLKVMLELQKKEITELKKEIKRLVKYIDTLSAPDEPDSAGQCENSDT